MTDRNDAMDSHVIFGALTRPAMTAGVTFEYFGLNAIVSMMTFICLGNLLYGLVCVPIHVVGWLVCREEPRFFTMAYKRLCYISGSENQSIWGVRCYEPF